MKNVRVRRRSGLSVAVVLSLVLSVGVGSAAQADAGSGSLAAGVAGGAGAVDPQTGALSFSASIGAIPGVGAGAVSLGLSYEMSQPADVGLGPGLSWGLPSVTETGSVFVFGGRSFPVSGTVPSGLAGYVLQDAVFESFPDPVTEGIAGCTQQVPCSFAMTHADGDVDGFDALGQLVSRADRDGNVAQYAWDELGRLSSVTGGFPGMPVSVALTYSASGVQVAFPQRGDGTVPGASLTWGDDGLLSSLTDTAGRVTEFSWSQNVYDGVSTSLLSQWNTSAGAQVNVTYQSYDPGVWAVSTLTTTDVHRQVPLAPTVTFDLDPNDDGHNYTGFPQWNGPPADPTASQTTDGLVASNDTGYHYSTSMTDGVSQTTRTYNWLHQLVNTLSEPVEEGAAASSSTELSYPQPDAEWPDVPAAYSLPVSTITTITDAAGGTRTVSTEAEYDGLGRQVSQTIGDVRTDTVYDTGQTDPAANGVRGYGQVLQVTATIVSGADAGLVREQVTTLTADRKHPEVVTARATDPGNSSGGLVVTSESSSQWDGSGQLLSSTVTVPGAGGQAQTQTHSAVYSAADGVRIVEVTDPAGGVTRSETDASSGLVTAVTTPDGVRTSTVYDASGRPVEVTGPFGSSAYVYVEAGLDGSGANSRTVTRAADGYAISVILDPVGRVVSSADNQVGGVVSSSASRTLSQTGYDGRGNVVSRISQAGLETGYEYDPATGQLSKVTLPGGSFVEYGYDVVAGTVTVAGFAEDGSAWSTSTRTIDDLGRTVSEQIGYADHSLGSTSTTGYSGFGEVASSFDSLSAATVTSARNASGTVVSSTVASDVVQASSQLTTSPMGAVVSKTLQVPGEGQVDSSVISYDQIGLPIGQTDPVGLSESYAYDSALRVVSDTRPDEWTRHLSFDSTSGLLSSTWWTSPQQPQTQTDGRSYAYDPVTGALGAVWYTADETSSKILYGYFPDGVLKSVTYADGAEIGYEYGDDGRLTRMTDAVGTVTDYTYDPATGRLVSAAQLGATVTYAYDPRGFPTEATRSVGSTASGKTAYTYDDGGRMLSAVATGPNGEAIEAHAYTWNAQGWLQSDAQVLGEQTPTPTEGPLAGQRSIVTTYAYDTLNRLTGEKTTAADGTALTETSYVLSAGSGLTSVVTQDASGTTTTEYTTDAAGRQTAVQVDAAEPVVITWDANGRQTNDRAGNQYSYTQDGQLAGWTTPDGDHTSLSWRADGSLDTQTDPDGTRVTTYQLPVAEAPVLTRVTTRGDNTTVESSLLGHSREAVVTGPGTEDAGAPSGSVTGSADTGGARPIARALPGCPVAPEPGASATPRPTPSTGGAPGDQETTALWLVSDQRGDVTTVLSLAGTPVEHRAYTAYGTSTSSSENPATVFGFAGALTFDTGLVHLTARAYDTGTGQFTTSDTVAALNLYLYANANPLAYTDPTGRTPKWVGKLRQIGGIALAFAGLVAGVVGTVASGGSALGVAALVVNAASLGLSYTAQWDEKLDARSHHALSWAGFATGVLGMLLGGGSDVDAALKQADSDAAFAADFKARMASGDPNIGAPSEGRITIRPDEDLSAASTRIRASVENVAPWRSMTDGAGPIELVAEPKWVKYDPMNADHVALNQAEAQTNYFSAEQGNVFDAAMKEPSGGERAMRFGNLLGSQAKQWQDIGVDISIRMNQDENYGKYVMRIFYEGDGADRRPLFNDHMFYPRAGYWRGDPELTRTILGLG